MPFTVFVYRVIKWNSSLTENEAVTRLAVLRSLIRSCSPYSSSILHPSAVSRSKTLSDNQYDRVVVPPPAPTAKSDYTVLITGFGPFGDIPITAGLIARLLPEHLEPSHPLNASARSITILGPKADFGTIAPTYTAVRQRIKELHAEFHDKVNVWIHLGQYSGDSITCERRAFRQDFSSSWNSEYGDPHYYVEPLLDGKTVDDIGANPWMSLPIGLDSEMPIDATVKTANAVLQKYQHTSGAQTLPVNAHVEAGARGCGFTFYESMANCVVAGRKRDVLFVHVPPSTDQSELVKARDAVLSIIGASIQAVADQAAG